MFDRLVEKNRSYRRFRQDDPVPPSVLRDLVALARLTPSARNVQPLRYVLVTAPADVDAVFPCLAWAGYLRDWPGPAPGERPTAYVVIVRDQTLHDAAGVDHGIVAQTMLLGAVDRGFGGCMLGAVDRDELRQVLAVPSRYDIMLVLALGRPAETVVIDDVAPDGSIEYWRDAEGRHHVPKRCVDDLLLSCKKVQS